MYLEILLSHSFFESKRALFHQSCVSAMTFQTEKGMKMGYNTNESGE